MDVERAEELTCQAYKGVEYLFHRSIPTVEGRPPTVESAEDWDCFNAMYGGDVFLAEEALGCTAATDEFTHGPIHPLTQGLARARRALAEIIDPPASLRPRIEECLRLVDAALFALDLPPGDPIIDAAAQMPWAERRPDL